MAGTNGSGVNRQARRAATKAKKTAPPKTAPKPSPTVGALQERIDLLSYLHAELAFKFNSLMVQLQMAMLQQAMQNPQTQKLIQERLMAQAAAGGMPINPLLQQNGQNG